MSFLEPSEVRPLKLFGWFLLLTNACIVALAVALGGKLDDPGPAWLGAAVLAVLALGR
jgi:hypothetical protein